LDDGPGRADFDIVSKKGAVQRHARHHFSTQFVTYRGFSLAGRANPRKKLRKRTWEVLENYEIGLRTEQLRGKRRMGSCPTTQQEKNCGNEPGNCLKTMKPAANSALRHWQAPAVAHRSAQASTRPRTSMAGDASSGVNTLSQRKWVRDIEV
jgi:hypothetical protein